MQLNVLVLPGDGIGVEVTREAVRVLRHVARKHGHNLVLSEGLLGGVAIHKTGSPLPEETVRLAALADAILMGAVGLPGFYSLLAATMAAGLAACAGVKTAATRGPAS